jgi:hypothetical protein
MSSIETTSDGKRAHLIGTPSGTGDRDSYGAPIRQRNDKIAVTAFSQRLAILLST